jgi:hypothetical protein
VALPAASARPDGIVGSMVTFVVTGITRLVLVGLGL